MHRRVTVVLLALVPVVALVVAIALHDGGSSTKAPAKLPIAFGSAAGTGSRAAAALDAREPAFAPYSPTRYVAAADLPDIGGTAAAYRVDGAAPNATTLADALGADPSSVSIQPSGQWYLSGTASDIAVASGCAVAPDDSTSSCPEPTTTTAPVSSLTADDAKAKGADVARAAGIEVDHATIDAQLNSGYWTVAVSPVVDGLPTSGFGVMLTIAPDGEVTYAMGIAGTPARADDYPRLTTREAIDQYNANMIVPEMGIAALPQPDGGPTTTTTHDVTITAATPALLYQPTYDGDGGYLIPAYELSTEDGTKIIAPAIDRVWFAPPPVDGTKSGGGTSSTGSGAPGSPPNSASSAPPAPEPTPVPCTTPGVNIDGDGCSIEPSPPVSSPMSADPGAPTPEPATTVASN